MPCPAVSCVQIHPLLTAIGMRHFARGCVNLQQLDLSGCSNLTDGALTVVVSTLSELTHLNIKGR